MTASNIFKYIAYAIGEILLIVIGINVALHFENINQDEQIQEELYKVYDIISHDLVLDTTNMGNRIKRLEEDQWISEAVLTKKMTAEILDSCYTCHYPALFTTNLIFYDRGFKLLKNNAEFNSLKNDSLNGAIMEYYDYVKGRVENITQKQIREDANFNINHWKINYTWFHDLETNPDFVNYSLTNPEYLNMVKKHYFLIHFNYLPSIKEAKKAAVDLLKQIDGITKEKS